MPRWRFSERAEADIRSIYRTIAHDNPRAADAVFQRILDRIETAAEHPLIGAPRPQFGEEARILVERPYIVLYRPDADGIYVAAIVHGARDPANWL